MELSVDLKLQDLEEARKSYEAALEIRKQIAEIDSRDLLYLRELAGAYGKMRSLENEAGNSEIARSWCEQMVEARKKVVAMGPSLDDE